MTVNSQFALDTTVPEVRTQVHTAELCSVQLQNIHISLVKQPIQLKTQCRLQICEFNCEYCLAPTYNKTA